MFCVAWEGSSDIVSLAIVWRTRGKNILLFSSSGLFARRTSSYLMGLIFLQVLDQIGHCRCWWWGWRAPGPPWCAGWGRRGSSRVSVWYLFSISILIWGILILILIKYVEIYLFPAKMVEKALVNILRNCSHLIDLSINCQFAGYLCQMSGLVLLINVLMLIHSRNYLSYLLWSQMHFLKVWGKNKIFLNFFYSGAPWGPFENFGQVSIWSILAL